MDVDGHCFYYTYGGRGFPGGIDWEGRPYKVRPGR